MTTFTTIDREEEENYLRLQLKIQQLEILRLNGVIQRLTEERNAYEAAYAALLGHNISKSLNKDDLDMDGRC
jgi:hypothetical protein